jgi:hypothetical protein
MKIRHFGAIALAGLALAGCSDDGPTFVNVGPRAVVRLINAAPDSPLIDARFIDQVENTRTFFSMPFKGSSGFYQSVNAGDRQLRIFRASPENAAQNPADFNVVSTVLLDTAITFREGGRYTMVLTGTVLPQRGSNTARLLVVEDTLPETVATGSVALRTWHVATGAGPVNVAVTPTAGATAGTSATGLAFGTRTPYVTVPALTGTALYSFALSGAVAATNAPAVPGLPGVAASATVAPQDPTAGVRQGQSVLSAFVFPAGTGANAAANPTASVVIFPDRNPPRLGQ